MTSQYDRLGGGDRIASLRAAARAAPTAQAFFALGGALLEELYSHPETLDEALACLLTVDTVVPLPDDYFAQVALTVVDIKVDAAIAWLERGVAAHPGAVKLHALLADFYRIIDRHSDADARWQRALELGGLPPPAIRNESGAEYNAGWQRYIDHTDTLLQQGERNLNRILGALERSVIEKNRAYLEFTYKNFGTFLYGELSFPTIGSYHLGDNVRRVQVMEILSHIDPDTDCIVELGSGYGRILLSLWLNGGPLRARYLGLEFTEAGVALGLKLAALQPDIAAAFLPFDYYHPELPALLGCKTFVFSSYSVEQIPMLPAAVVDAIVRFPSVYRVVHVEPVGWQRPFEIDPELPSRHKEMLYRMRSSARHLNYNANLLALLEQKQREGCLRVVLRRYDFLSSRASLPASVIVWEPIRS
jgi:tetratricopeptide (TPR) repeat protein